MTQDEMIKEARAVISNNNIDSLLFYMQEYRELGYKNIANIFSVVFAIFANEVATNMENNEKEERNYNK